MLIDDDKRTLLAGFALIVRGLNCIRASHTLYRIPLGNPVEEVQAWA